MEMNKKDRATFGLDALEVSGIQIRIVQNGKDGLLAWASCVLNDAVHLNNIAIRRGHDGRLMLTYPAKRTGAGSRYYYFNPISSEAADAVRDAVLARLAVLAKAAEIVPQESP